jgi:hypothetical protein
VTVAFQLALRARLLRPCVRRRHEPVDWPRAGIESLRNPANSDSRDGRFVQQIAIVPWQALAMPVAVWITPGTGAAKTECPGVARVVQGG